MLEVPAAVPCLVEWHQPALDRSLSSSVKDTGLSSVTFAPPLSRSKKEEALRPPLWLSPQPFSNSDRVTNRSGSSFECLRTSELPASSLQRDPKRPATQSRER